MYGKLVMRGQGAGRGTRNMTNSIELQALEALQNLWRASALSTSDASLACGADLILVDLMHGHSEFLARTLVVAKAVQAVRGGRLVGLLGSPGVVARSTSIDADVNRRFAEAFELSSVIEVPIDLDSRGSAEASALAAVEDLAAAVEEGAALSPDQRHALAAIETSDGLPFGRILLETFMRAELQPAVQGGIRLVYWARHVLAFDNWICGLIEELRPVAFVTGHIDYCPWGHLAQRLVKAGGRVVYFRCDNRVPITLIDSLDAPETLNGRLRRIETRAFADFEARLAALDGAAARWTRIATARIGAVQRGLARNWRWSSAAVPLAWTLPFDPGRPTYVLFAHTFTDQPMADESLFADHADWVEATVEHAIRSQAYNLLVKLHPLDSSYDLSGLGNTLSARYAAVANVRFTRELIPQVSLAAACAAGITVRGTPGIEMAAHGLPMILAGHGPYSELGFCLRPERQRDYFDLLERGPPFPIAMCEQAPRAILYQAFERFWSAPASILTPAFRACEPEEVDRFLAQAAQAAVLETDPLCLALSRAWPRRNAKVAALELELALCDAVVP